MTIHSRLLFFVLLLSLVYPAAADSTRPKIGLVLAGGGARGIAHVGVIQVLEELKVPVDAIAGTSMGALVGGLYASGRSPDELAEVVSAMDWAQAFADSVDRGELPPRRKSDDFDYATGVSLSFKDGKVALPLGMVQGQQVRQLIKELMQPVIEVDDFDDMPIPYRAVATDIETGEAYVFADGNVVTAMRASMSLPALLAPVEHEGRLLVDGGMANNIPVDVARAMGVDHVIVVDIGTPLKSREEISSLLTVADQVLGFLTRKNSEEQLASLKDDDILIRPQLDGIGMLSFEQDQKIQRRGYQAAKAMASQLQRLSLSESAWNDHLATRMIPPVSNPVIQFVAVENDASIDDKAILLLLSQPLGVSLDRDKLRYDIQEIYALDYWESIDYHLINDGDATGLLLSAKAKSWGENSLKVGLNLLTDLQGGSEFNIGASYLMKGINGRGGELYSRAQLGDLILLSGEYYQPLDYGSRFFFAPFLGYADQQVYSLGPEFDANEFVAVWRVRKLEAEVAGGFNLFGDSQFRLGLFRGWGEYRNDFDRESDIPENSFQEGGLFASYRYDSLDNAFFPSRGALVYTDIEWQRDTLGASRDFERLQLFGQAAFSFGHEQRNTVLFTGKLGLTEGATNEPQNYQQLGGLFNLSGLSQNFYSGRQMAFVMAQYQRRISDSSVMPMDFPAFVGFSVEGGQLWSDKDEVAADELIGAGSIYIGLKTPLGPIYLAYGRSEDSLDALYVSLGWPFLSGNNRLRR